MFQTELKESLSGALLKVPNLQTRLPAPVLLSAFTSILDAGRELGVSAPTTGSFLLPHLRVSDKCFPSPDFRYGLRGQRWLSRLPTPHPHWQGVVPKFISGRKDRFLDNPLSAKTLKMLAYFFNFQGFIFFVPASKALAFDGYAAPDMQETDKSHL